MTRPTGFDAWLALSALIGCQLGCDGEVRLVDGVPINFAGESPPGTGLDEPVTDESSVDRPFTRADLEAFDAGAELYSSNCAQCHVITGLTDTQVSLTFAARGGATSISATVLAPTGNEISMNLMDFWRAEEGLLVSPSSAAAVPAALAVARALDEGADVTVLPDNAGRYLSKYLSDDWMKLYGFGDDTKSEGLVEELLTSAGRDPITIGEQEPLSRAIELMRANGVSQLPVTSATGNPNAMVHEIDVLRGMHGGGVSPDAPIKTVATELAGVVHPKARIEELYPIFDRDQVAVVVDSGKAIAVLSQIDLIDHLAGRPAHAAV